MPRHDEEVFLLPGVPAHRPRGEEKQEDIEEGGMTDIEALRSLYWKFKSTDRGFDFSLKSCNRPLCVASMNKRGNTNCRKCVKRFGEYLGFKYIGKGSCRYIEMGGQTFRKVCIEILVPFYVDGTRIDIIYQVFKEAILKHLKREIRKLEAKNVS